MMPRGRRASARPRRRISPARQLLMQKKRECPIAALGIKEVDYLDTELLSRFIAENGMITASRLSGVSARMQRRLAVAVKRARFLALLPYADQHISGKP